MTEFAYPWVLLGLAAIPLLWYYFRMRKRAALVVPSSRVFEQIGARKRLLPWTEYLYLAAAALLIVALARPRFGDEKVLIRSRGIDIVLALDLSGSMATYDVPRKIGSARELQQGLKDNTIQNRLEAAKTELRKFVQQRPNDRIGLIGFAPMAYNIVPPTLDHAWLLGRLDDLKPGIIGDRTGIAAPIASGVHRLKSSDAPRRVLVLFTDGKNNIDNRITPEQAAELAGGAQVIVHTVGVGGENAFAIDNGRLLPVQDSFDEPLLRAIAEKSGGNYFHAADADGMAQVMRAINQLEKTDFEQPKFVEYREYAPALIPVALALLLLAFVADTTFAVRLP